MSKKLLMNNYSKNDDEIILCENFYPNKKPFYLWQDKPIDWDKYELYINIDISMTPSRQMQKILVISSATDIGTYYGGRKIHLYYTTNNIFNIQLVNNTDAPGYSYSLSSCNKQKLQIIINKKGIYLEEKLIVSIMDKYFKFIIESLKTSNNTIGYLGDNMCIYHKVSLRKYRERG